MTLLAALDELLVGLGSVVEAGLVWLLFRPRLLAWLGAASAVAVALAGRSWLLVVPSVCLAGFGVWMSPR